MALMAGLYHQNPGRNKMTNQTKTIHTAGPWTEHIKTENGRNNYFITAGDIPIAKIQYGFMSRRTEDGNARLISAAPELLELCKKSLEALNFIRNTTIYPDTSNEFKTYQIAKLLEQAIAKVNGKEK